jgi:hypothetical protein
VSVGGWQNRVRRSWRDVVDELKSAAANPDTGYATLVPYAAELLPAAVVQPQDVHRELTTVAAAVDRAVARSSVERGDGPIPMAVLEMMDVGNALECVGLALADATHAVFRDWLARMQITRDEPTMIDVWSAGFAALALDERPTYRRIAARAGETTLTLTEGATFGFNVQALLGHFAAAVENRAPAQAVAAAWDEMLANYDTLHQGGSARLGTLLWAARVVHHRIGGAPLREVAQRLQDDVRRIAGLP